MFKNLWKYSKCRFYILNVIWNYKFWLFSKKIYRNVNHTVSNKENYEMDYTFMLKSTRKTITSKRFSGYLFEGHIYHDNPGIQGIDSETWYVWHKKGLIN